MSSGLSILSARYGVGSTTIDVKSSVLAHTKDGSINLVVNPSSLNIEDPAVGQLKTLTVEYTINGGSSNITSVKDGDYLKIDAPPERSASGLQIVKAEYGYQGNFADVTSAIQNYLSNGSISITVSPSTVGIPDPNPAKPKLLKVDFTVNGASMSQSIPDGQKFTISAPPINRDATTPVADSVTSVSSALFSGIWSLIKYTFFLTTIFLAMDFGELKFGTGGKWGFAALTFLTAGFFPIFILPVIIFWWRMFSVNDVYPTS
jgi:hypothetical protein